jgi:hypothetical protein
MADTDTILLPSKCNENANIDHVSDSHFLARIPAGNKSLEKYGVL